MPVVCPHCRNVIESVADPQSGEHSCDACGSSFRAENAHATASWADAGAGRLVGRFEVISTLGSGAFGTVYKARDPSLHRSVAVKVPRRGTVGDNPKDVERFLREARSVAQLKHPGIASVYEVGTADGSPYLVSDFIDGVTLADKLTAGRPTPRESAELVAAVADALQHAHAAGVVHRDVKPSNVMVRPDGTPVVLDFGLAKREAAEATMTADGQVLGTPAYMSPEQARGDAHAVDGRADVYSLGVVLYQLLTGELPFRGNTRMLMHQVLHDDPQPPRKLNDQIPRDLDTIAMKAMAKEPARRYATAADLAADLNRFLAGESILARPVGKVEKAGRWVRRNPAVAALLAAVALLLVAVAVGSLAFSVSLAEQKAAAEKGERDAADARDKEAEARKTADAALVSEKSTKSMLKAALDTMTTQKEAMEVISELEKQAKEKTAKALQRADGLRLAAEAAAAVRTDPALALRLAAAGVKRHPHHLTFAALYEVAGELREERTIPVVGTGTAMKFARFSPDGTKLLVVQDMDDGGKTPWTAAVARVLDAATGKQLAAWPGYGLTPTAVDWSGDGTRVAVAVAGRREAVFSDKKQPTRAVYTDRAVYVFDPVTGADLYHLTGHADRVASVRFSPDGAKLVTASWDTTARVWDAKTGKQLHLLEGHKASLRDARFSGDGKKVVTFAAGKLQQSGEDAPWFGLPPAGVIPVADPGPADRSRPVWFRSLPESTGFVSGGGEATIARVWDAETGKEVAKLKKNRPDGVFGHQWTPTAGDVSRDGTRIVIGFSDGTAAVWDAAAGGFEKTLLKGHTGEVTDATFNVTGNLVATAGADQSARTWFSDTGDEINLARVLGHVAAVRTMRFGARFGPKIEHYNLTTSDDGTARLNDLKGEKPPVVLRGHRGPLADAAFSSDGKRVVTAGDTTARVWSVAPSPPVARELRGHDKPLTALTFSPDGSKLLTASEDETARLWDAATGKELRALGKGLLLGPVRDATFSPDGKLVVTASETTTGIKNGKTVNPSAVHVWDAATGEDKLQLAAHGTAAAVARFTPDGGRLLTVGDGYVRSAGGALSGSDGNSEKAGVARVWDAATGKIVATLADQARPNAVPQFRRDGTAVFLPPKGSLDTLYDTATGAVVRTFPPDRRGWSLDSAYSPDGKWVATVGGSRDRNEVAVWDAAAGTVRWVFPLLRPRRPVFSPDGAKLAALSAEGAAVWDLATGAEVCRCTGHEDLVLTAAFSRDGTKLLTGSNDKTAALWDAKTGKLLTVYMGHPGPVKFAAFSPKGDAVTTGSTDGVARVWPLDIVPGLLARAPRGLTLGEKVRYDFPEGGKEK